MPPEHSTISRTRRLIDLETHRAVFTWILQVLATADLVNGKTIGIDATTLEANAALRSIVRRDSGETYQEFLTRLAQASGVDTPTRADLARLDRKRPKKCRNTEWRHPHDPDARITKMKDGGTHLAHKAEHAVDLETGAIVGVTVQAADQGDTTTIAATVTAAAGGCGDRRSHSGHRGSRRRQGVSQQSGAGGSRRARPPDLHRRTGPRPAAMDEASRRTRRGVRESSAHPRHAGSRGCNAAGANDWAAHAPARARQHLETAVCPPRRLQFGLLMRTLVGGGTPRGLQGRVMLLVAAVLATWANHATSWRDWRTRIGDRGDAFTPHHRFEFLSVALEQDL